MTDQLRSIYDRWSRLEEEKQAISDDLKDLFAEAKAHGYDGKALRAAFRIKAMSSDEVAKRDEHDALVDLYLAGLSGTGSATRAPASRAKAGTDTSLDRPTRVDGTARPAAAAKEAAGTHSDVAPVTPVPEATEPRADDTRTAARGNPSDDDWPEMPAFLVRTEQGRG